MLPVSEDDIHLAPYYAAKLRSFGDDFTSTKKKRDKARRGFDKEFSQIKLSFDRVSSVLDRHSDAARICVDFVNNKGLWLLDIYRPISERLSWFERARRAALLIGDDRSLVSILHNLGIATLNDGRAHDAIKIHKDELAVARRAKHAVGKAQATSSIGTCYRQLGQYREAARWHRKVLALGDIDEIANVRLNALGNIGIILMLTRQPEKACEYFKATLKMTRQLKRRREEAYAIGYLGQAYQEMGRPKKALAQHRLALKISKGFDKVGEAGAIGGIGNALVELNQTSQALICHRKQLRLAQGTGQRTAVAEALTNLGISLLLSHKGAEAEARRAEAIKMYEGMPNPAALARLEERWSSACERLGKLDQAISTCERAIELSVHNKLPGIGLLKRRAATLQRVARRST
jgi:tetratricopeptide (TPR) repeat protein